MKLTGPLLNENLAVLVVNGRLRGSHKDKKIANIQLQFLKRSKESWQWCLISKVKPPTYGRFPPKPWLLGSTRREDAHVGWLVGVHGEIDKV